MPRGAGGVQWFQELFGFAESGYAASRANFKLEEDGQVLVVLRPPARFRIGPFELPSLRELGERVRARPPPAELGGLCFQNMAGAQADVRSLLRDPANAGCVFQVASQTNCLEMTGPGVKPEEGIAIYAKDPTQGPAAAMACAPATVFRNYLVNGTGQGGGRQIDILRDFGEAVGNAKHGYWRTVNGYVLGCSPEAIEQLGARILRGAGAAEGGEEAAAIRDAAERIRVGVHWSTQVGKHPHEVCQVFTSALPVGPAYNKDPVIKSETYQPFAQLVLDAMYDATLACAEVLAAQRGERVRVYLTAVGGGAFGNRQGWIVEAISRALDKHAASPLDVYLVHFSGVPKGMYADLEKGRPQPAAAAGAAGRRRTATPPRARSPARPAA
eukprot:TRINITY_DN40367_c0_g1_i1.p1 TRINITY_DN40367_c0_g1~~TRINITY_DN40367_c0_g1_i1.p1  ORF type:complete len:408 (+),score=118.52 TRINITY_DN40367_c0_g1_i1:70-1224(+)